MPVRSLPQHDYSLIADGSCTASNNRRIIGVIMDETEVTLVGRARKSDESAFERLVATALPKVLGMSRRMLRDDQDAWDVAQDAFVKAWTRLDEFRGDAAFSTWVCGIASRLAIDRIRARRRESDSEVDDALGSDRPGPDRVTEERSLAAAIGCAVAGLPEAERSVFTLHEESGMKYREVASALGIPIGTVMSRLHSARTRLQKALAPWWKEKSA